MGILLPDASSIAFVNTLEQLREMAVQALDEIGSSGFGSIDAEVKEAIENANTCTTLIGGIDAYFAHFMPSIQASESVRSVQIEAQRQLKQVRDYAWQKRGAMEREVDLRQSEALHSLREHVS